MDIKIKKISYDEIGKLKLTPHKKPKRANMFFRTLMRLVAMPGLKKVGFKCEKVGMEKLGKKEPALFLMNHSCFTDFEIMSTILYPRAYNVITSTDAFVGKDWLFRQIGNMPTRKFIPDPTMIRDAAYAVKTLKNSVLMFPEACYSFDGTANSIPDSIGKFIKLLSVPVVMIKTEGAFLHNPLYNNLQRRKVKVSARMSYELSAEQVKSMSVGELQDYVKKLFTFDNFAYQFENKIKVDEPFRADFLNRVLYKCPSCKTEGRMEGKGVYLSCKACGKKYELTEYGKMQAVEGDTEFAHIPDWNRWQRECARNELENGCYKVSIPVNICMAVDRNHIYEVGEGTLEQDCGGFRLVGCDDKLCYEQKHNFAHTVNADFYWYQIGDMIAIGSFNAIYYCFPKVDYDIVAKMKIIAEEAYNKGRKKS